MNIKRFIASRTANEAQNELYCMIKDVDIGKSYADMMRLRLSGKLENECHDVYYVATEGSHAIGRHWMGWGKHINSIGNWGNFFTDEKYRGKGVGAALLRAWQADLISPEHSPLPLAFFCSSATPELAALYVRLGFKIAIKGRDCGPLYMPLGESPDSFEEFCELYYTPSPTIRRCPASIGFRHEIDCLLRFYFINNGLEFGIKDAKSLEDILLHSPERAELFFTEEKKCVGWTLDGEAQIHPKYKDSVII